MKNQLISRGLNAKKYGIIFSVGGQGATLGSTAVHTLGRRRNAATEGSCLLSIWYLLLDDLKGYVENTNKTLTKHFPLTRNRRIIRRTCRDKR